MRKEGNREKYKEYDHRYYIKHRRPNSKIGKLETKISDLEAKLADKEKENEIPTAKLEQANEIINNPDTLIFQQQELIDNLQSQIAEKETEIEFLEGTINSMQEDISYWEQQLTEKEKEIEDLKAQRHIYLNRSVEECNKITDLEFELQHKYQDKISFSIAQLEKVKSAFGLINSKLDKAETIKEYIHYIDHQINELKGEV